LNAAGLNALKSGLLRKKGKTMRIIKTLAAKDFQVKIMQDTYGEFTAWFQRKTKSDDSDIYDRRTYKTLKAAEKSGKQWLQRVVANAYA
jgi:hypothetical protein